MYYEDTKSFANKKTSTKSGLGLGLYIVLLKLAAKYEWENNKCELGATFSFTPPTTLWQWFDSKNSILIEKSRLSNDLKKKSTP